jgi:hypothetical protein
VTKKEYIPSPTITLTELEALKTIADPFRTQIMEVLTPEPLTVNQVAEKLGVTASKLYYHINLLERDGFITVVDTTLHGNLIEKHYWITAYDFDLDKDLCNFSVETSEGKDQLITLLLANVETTRDDLRRSLEARHYQIQQGAEPHPRTVFDYREIFNIPDEKAEAFHQRLRGLVQEFMEETKDIKKSKETHPWAISIVMYPSFYYDEMDEAKTGE